MTHLIRGLVIMLACGHVLAGPSALLEALEPPSAGKAAVYVIKRNPLRLGQVVSIYEAKIDGAEAVDPTTVNGDTVEPFGFGEGKTYFLKGRGYYRHECSPGPRMLYLGQGWNRNDGIPRSAKSATRIYANLEPGKIYGLLVDSANWRLNDLAERTDKWDSVTNLVQQKSPQLAVEERKPKLAERVRRLITKEMSKDKTVKKNVKLLERIVANDKNKSDARRYIQSLN